MIYTLRLISLSQEKRLCNAGRCPSIHLRDRKCVRHLIAGPSRCTEALGVMGRVSGVLVLMALNDRHLGNNALSVSPNMLHTGAKHMTIYHGRRISTFWKVRWISLNSKHCLCCEYQPEPGDRGIWVEVLFDWNVLAVFHSDAGNPISALSVCFLNCAISYFLRG